MRWLYRVQQRLALTRQEATAILTLALLAVIGLMGMYIQQQPTPLPEETRAAYARADSLLDAGAQQRRPAAPGEPTSAAPTEQRGAERGPPLVTGEARARPSFAAPDEPESRARVNVNTATAAQLERLPRIGPTLAQRIIDYREANGPFRRVGELRQVRGIGEKTVAGLAPLVTVGPADGTP